MHVSSQITYRYRRVLYIKINTSFGELDAYQLPSGTIIVKDDEYSTTKLAETVCIYARVSSSENKDNLKRQSQRLKDYALAKGYKIYKVVEEIGSGLNDNRKKLLTILADDKFTVLLVEHKDRLTRFGANYIQLLLTQTGRRLEIVNGADNDKDDLMTDFASVITSFCSRLYGLRRAKRKTEKIIAELESSNGDD
ncbi:MAG: IS607 family transposase [Prochloraceae cyanobacterium]|nr:IS607 family transposase [Prochloraceae cyanobacterium]